MKKNKKKIINQKHRIKRAEYEYVYEFMSDEKSPLQNRWRIKKTNTRKCVQIKRTALVPARDKKKHKHICCRFSVRKFVFFFYLFTFRAHQICSAETRAFQLTRVRPATIAVKPIFSTYACDG